MKPILYIATAVALALFPVKSFAQMDERKPGIYAVTGEVSTPLKYSYNTSGVSSGGLSGISVSIKKYKFKGETSGVVSSDTLVLVINPKKRVGVVSPGKFDLFIKGITPDDILVLPLVVNYEKHCREYDPGITVGVADASFNLKSQDRIAFEWEQISDNSYMIRIPGLTPGEYGVIFRLSKLSSFDYDALLGFTIPEKE